MERLSAWQKIIVITALLFGLVIGLGGAFIVSRVMSIPPKKVPANLSAQEYYDLGIKYKLAGWISQSKQSLQLSTKLDPNGIGKQAHTYSLAYLPAQNVSDEAVLENIKAVNKSAIDKVGAEKAYRKCIEKYPNFEWPYGNLGFLYIKDGRLNEAKEVLNKALEINPHYTNGLIHLAGAYFKEHNFAKTDELLKRVLDNDPHVRSNALPNYPELEKRIEELKRASKP